MNTVNTLTGYSSFQLCLGLSPRLIPPLVPPQNEDNAEPPDISLILEQLHNNISNAQDSLTTTKIYQAHYANAHHRVEENFQEGDFVMLNTKNCHHKYKAKNQKRSAKFFPCYNRP